MSLPEILDDTSSSSKLASSAAPTPAPVSAARTRTMHTANTTAAASSTPTTYRVLGINNNNAAARRQQQVVNPLPLNSDNTSTMMATSGIQLDSDDDEHNPILPPRSMGLGGSASSNGGPGSLGGLGGLPAPLSMSRVDSNLSYSEQQAKMMESCSQIQLLYKKTMNNNNNYNNNNENVGPGFDAPKITKLPFYSPATSTRILAANTRTSGPNATSSNKSSTRSNTRGGGGVNATSSRASLDNGSISSSSSYFDSTDGIFTPNTEPTVPRRIAGLSRNNNDADAVAVTAAASDEYEDDLIARPRQRPPPPPTQQHSMVGGSVHTITEVSPNPDL